MSTATNLMTVAAAASVLSLDAFAVRRLAARGRLKAYRVSDSELRLGAETVDAYVRGGTLDSAPPLSGNWFRDEEGRLAASFPAAVLQAAADQRLSDGDVARLHRDGQAAIEVTLAFSPAIREVVNSLAPAPSTFGLGGKAPRAESFGMAYLAAALRSKARMVIDGRREKGAPLDTLYRDAETYAAIVREASAAVLRDSLYESESRTLKRQGQADIVAAVRYSLPNASWATDRMARAAALAF